MKIENAIIILMPSTNIEITNGENDSFKGTICLTPDRIKNMLESELKALVNNRGNGDVNDLLALAAAVDAYERLQGLFSAKRDNLSRDVSLLVPSVAKLPAEASEHGSVDLGSAAGPAVT